MSEAETDKTTGMEAVDNSSSDAVAETSKDGKEDEKEWTQLMGDTILLKVRQRSRLLSLSAIVV